MPKYETQCACGHQGEQTAKMAEMSSLRCPTCGRPVEILISRPSHVTADQRYQMKAIIGGDGRSGYQVAGQFGREARKNKGGSL